MSATPSLSARRVRSPRTLDALAVACALIAVALLLWPVSGGVVEAGASREPAGSASPPPPVAVEPAASAEAVTATVASAESDSLLGAVINGNVFSATRRAPRVRFSPPGQRALEAELPTDPAEDASGVTADDALPRLSGIVAVNGERRALLQFVAADEVPKLYRINESHAGYRIVQIGPDRVVLASRAGTRTLRLSHRAPPDSLEKQP